MVRYIMYLACLLIDPLSNVFIVRRLRSELMKYVCVLFRWVPTLLILRGALS